MVLPNGNFWPPVDAADQALLRDTLDQARASVGLSVSDTMLDLRVRVKDGQKVQVERVVPLWVEIALPF